MRHHRSPDIPTGAPLTAALEPLYEVHRARVDLAYQRIQTINAGRQAPADARQAATELTAARPTARPPGPWHHRHATLAVPPPYRGGRASWCGCTRSTCGWVVRRSTASVCTSRAR